VAVPQLKRLVAGFPLRRAGFASGQSMWGLWWTKWHWGRFSPSTSVSLANHYSTNFSIIIITRGWHNRHISGLSAEWTQFDSTPPLFQLKNLILSCIHWYRSRDSVACIANGYGVGVRVPVGSRIFSSPRRPDELWGPPSLLSNGYRRLFPQG
jgi:hypothetical protein